MKVKKLKEKLNKLDNEKEIKLSQWSVNYKEKLYLDNIEISKKDDFFIIE